MISAAAAEHQSQSGTLVLSPGMYAQVQASVKALALADGYWRCLGLQGDLLPISTRPEPVALPDVETLFIPEAIRQRETHGDFRQVVSVFLQLQGMETRQDLDNTPGSFRAGLTCCPMYAGLSGSDARGEFTCYGYGINLAARLMIAAPWGSLWMDEHLAGRARAQYVTEYVDHLPFKGFAEKQPVYALIERRPPGENFFEGRLVGRQIELAELSAFVQPLFAPVGARRFAGILALVGDAGLGKSRLLYKFLTDDHGPVTGKAQVFTCQVDQVLRQPLNPFRYWLQRYFDQSPTQSSERNKRAFSRKFERLLGTVSDLPLAQELNRTRSCLGALVGLEWESSLYARLTPQGRYENTLQALKALLKAESLRQPVLLVLEDAHWLDEDSQAFVQLLAREIETFPLGVIATARPEREGALFGASLPYRQVELAGFSLDELAVLAADRLGGAPTPGLLELLAERAGNNLFFAEQILLYLRELGRLAQADGQWGLATGSAEAPLPDQVRAIFIARLDRLAKDIQDVVQAAAVLGREFEVRILAQMLSAGKVSQVEQWVSQAEGEHIWAAMSQVRYLFKHALLRDAAYEMQLKARRRALHHLAAESLEQVYAAELTEHLGEIAYHYEAACQQGLKALRPQAVYYLEEAGKAAAARHENGLAADQFSRALNLLDEDESPAAGIVETRLRLLLAREGVYDLLGQREAQRADLSAVEALVQTRQLPAEQAELRLRQAQLANATGDYTQALAAAQAAGDAARAAGEIGLESRAQLAWGEALLRQNSYAAAAEHLHLALALAEAGAYKDLQASSLRLLGSTAYFQDDYAATRLYSEQSLILCREIGDKLGESKALNIMGIYFITQSDYAAADVYYEQSLALCQEIGDRLGASKALGNLGRNLADQGNYAAAGVYFEQALALGREIGNRLGESCNLESLGKNFADQGNYAVAGVYFEQALALCREIDNQLGESTILSELGSIFANQGNYAAAKMYFEQALALFRKIGYRLGESIVLSNLGNLLAVQGDYAAACGYYEQALALIREMGQANFAAESLTGLAESTLALGDPQTAQAYLLEMLPILESNPTLVGDARPVRVLLRYGKTLRALGDPRGQVILEQAHTRLQEQASKIADQAARRIFLENVPENRELCALCARQPGEVQPIQAPLPEQELLAAPTLTASVGQEEPPAFPEPTQFSPVPETPPAPEPAPVPTDSGSTVPSVSGLDRQAFVAQISALIEQATQSQKGTLVVLGDIHIHIEKIDIKFPSHS